MRKEFFTEVKIQISSGFDCVGRGERHLRRESEWDDRRAVQRRMMGDVREVPDRKLRRGRRVMRTLSSTEP